MPIGQFYHSIDDKGRLFIPAKIREDLEFTFIITKGLDGCLYGYSLSEWRILEEKIRSLPSAKSRDIQRFLFASAISVTADKQGRVVIPSALREFAGLEKDVAVLGVGSRIEIWDKAKWEAVCNGITADQVADTMNELGF